MGEVEKGFTQMKTLRLLSFFVSIVPLLYAQGPFMNDTLPITVPAGETNTVVAQTGTGVVDKAGSGLLILQDPGLSTVSCGCAGVACRCFRCYAGHTPDTVFARAVFMSMPRRVQHHNGRRGAVTEWRDLRGAGYPFAVPPDTAPLWTANALNGLPVVDFGIMPFSTGQIRGMHWSREFPAV